MFTTIFPLLLLTLFSLIIEAIYSYRRYLSDNKVNTAPCKAWDGANFKEISIANLKEGNFVILYNKERVPADLILLCTGSPDYKCFIDSSGILDGKNLVTKFPVESIRFQLGFENISEVTYKLKTIKGEAIVPLPNAEFSSFDATIKLKVAPSASKVKMKNFLLRDSKIMNTPWAIGLVVYTGNETKAWINASHLPRKKSTLEKTLDSFTVVLCVAILILAGISTILSHFVGKNPSFLDPGKTLLHFSLLYGVLVPVPIYLILDLVRVIRIYRINNKSGVAFNNRNVLEDLGKVEYILTDKTGTITETETNISMCLLKNQFYGNIEDLIDKEGSANSSENPNDLGLQDDLSNVKGHFIMSLAVCNKGFTNDYGESYLTKSADERVLLNTALILGLKVVKRTDKILTILKDNFEINYRIIGYQGMSRKRNKTHIVLQSEDQSQCFLYIIGNFAAMDEVVHFMEKQDEDIIDIVKSNKKSGIRQVVCAFKELNKRDVQLFKEAYAKAIRSPINKQGRVESLFEEIEENAEYLGLIGLEEAVSLDTKVAVTALKHAGIKIWMLSGDTFDSSLSAGLGSGIIDDTIPLISIHDAKSEDEVLITTDMLLERYLSPEQNQGRVLRRNTITIINNPLSHLNTEKSSETPKNCQKIDFFREKFRNLPSGEDFQTKQSNIISQINSSDFQRGKSIHPLVSKLTNIRQNSSNGSQMKINSNPHKYSLFVDSMSLEVALRSEETMKKMVLLMFCANSVCFTSLLPSDKTKIAKLLRDNFSFHPVFIAIGDGSSDVGMIKAANIGIGMIGEEGNQAASASDIKVHEFSDLGDLILQHGFLVNYNLKKSLMLGIYCISVLFTFMFLFSFATDYSGNVFIPEQWYISFYLVYSVFGSVVIGGFDTEISMQELEGNLKMYFSLAVEKLKYKKVLGFFALGFAHVGSAMVVYKCGFKGTAENILIESMVVFISINSSLVVVSFTVTKDFNILTTAGPICGLGCCIAMIFIQSYSQNNEAFGAVQMLTESNGAVVHTIMLVLFQTIVVMGPFYWQQLFRPTPLDYFRGEGKTRLVKAVKSRMHSFTQNLNEVFTLHDQNFDKEKLESTNFSYLTLRYNSPKRQKKYIAQILKDRIRICIIFIICAIILLGSHMITTVVLYFPSTLRLSLDCILILIFVVILYFLIQNPEESVAIFLLRFIYIFSSSIVLMAFQVYEIRPMLSILYPFTFFLFITEDWLIMITCNILTSVSIFSLAAHFSFQMDQSGLYIAQFTGLYLTSCLTSGVIGYTIQVYNLKQYNLVQRAEEEFDKVTSVLDYLLPSFVRKRVKDGVRYIAEDQGEVTVVFVYIVDFEKITAEYSIEELTSLLDEIFGKIDSICELVGVSKIETVGNTYMACAGLKDSESEIKKNLRIIPHARRAIEFGFAILRAAQQICLKNGEKLVLKIGIHSGTVTAGVVGFHKPQFSLVGDTVNTASRMASTAEKSTIQVSKATYEQIGDSKNFNCKLNFVEVKGKGKMETFTITLQQMMNPREHFVESRISVSFSSMGQASFFIGESSYSEESDRDLLKELKIFKTEDYFEPGEGILENVRFFSLKCFEAQQETNFRKVVQENTFWICTSGIFFEAALSVLMIVTLFSYGVDGEYLVYLVVVLFVEVALLAVALIYVRKKYKEYWFYVCINIVYLVGLFISISAYFQYSQSDIIAMEVLFHFQLFSCCSGLFFSEMMCLEVVALLLWVITLVYQDHYSNTLPSFLAGSCYFIITNIYTMYLREKKLRIYTNLAIIANKELDKTDALLTQMIPAHVYKHLKEENTVTDIFFQVTVIYADIVGFTPWSSGRDAREIVEMLSMLFRKFDKSSVKHHVYKVHTIGDCYVAMGYHGIEARNPTEECQNMINFAYSMLEIIAKVRVKHEQLNMRIGLHTGDVIGGVMGTSIVRYDIYGVDVLVANQMESNGIPGSIVISESTRQFLEKAQPKVYKYEKHAEVKAMDRIYRAYKLIKN